MAKRRKLQSDGGYVTKPRGILPVSSLSLEHMSEREQEISHYNQMVKDMSNPKKPAPFYKSRRLVITLEL